jgi:hypothetical protein
MEENKAQTTQTEESAGGAIAGTEASEASAAVDTATDNDAVNAESFDDGAPAEGKPKQSNDLNREYARKRREAEHAKKIEETRVQTVIETLGGVNPFTNEPMTDAADVEEYRLMKRIEKEGGDPVTDYAKYRKQADKEGAQKAEAKATKDAWYANDRASFVKDHPDVNLDELIRDPNFQSYADGKVGRVPLSEIYEGYAKLTKSVDGKAKDLAAQALANRQASPGSAASSGTTDSDFYTAEQVRKMSKAEIHDNYEKIRKSMAKW